MLAVLESAAGQEHRQVDVLWLRHRPWLGEVGLQELGLRLWNVNVFGTVDQIRRRILGIDPRVKPVLGLPLAVVRGAGLGLLFIYMPCTV